MKRTRCEQTELYILFLTGVYNLIFVDISLAGMPLRTLILLLAGFLCIAVNIYKREIELPRWRDCGIYEKMVAALIVISVVALVICALTESDHFWMVVDIVALLLVSPCIYGKKKFPQDVFCVYSVCSSVVCIVSLIYDLTGGICEPLIALLIQKNAIVSWLVLSIMMNMIAYCFQEKGQVWYGSNIVLAAFLLAIHKNVFGMVLVGLVPLMLPIFCRPSKLLVGRAAQTELMYVFLICNMSLITGYTPLMEGIVTYDLEISVYMELMLAAMGVWFLEYWDRYAQNTDANATVTEMRVWCRKAITACLAGSIGIITMAELFEAEDASAWERAAQMIISDVRENEGWRSGLLGQMGQCYGIWGIAIACVLFYIIITRVCNTRRWRVKAHKLYRLIAVVGLLQALFLPQTMVSLPVYGVFFFLFMETEEQPRKMVMDQEKEQDNTTEQRKGDDVDEADYSDPMLQRSGDFGDRTE